MRIEVRQVLLNQPGGGPRVARKRRALGRIPVKLGIEIVRQHRYPFGERPELLPSILIRARGRVTRRGLVDDVGIVNQRRLVWPGSRSFEIGPIESGNYDRLL